MQFFGYFKICVEKMPRAYVRVPCATALNISQSKKVLDEAIWTFMYATSKKNWININKKSCITEFTHMI